MDTDIFQRAGALAALIEGATHDPHRARTTDPPREELEWSASALIAQLWCTGRYLVEPLRESDVQRALGTDRFAQLRDKGLIRVIIGEVVPTRIYGYGPPTRLDAADEADLTRLREMLRDPARHRFWIAGEQLRATISAHAAAHPATPSFETIVGRAFDAHADDGIDGFAMRFEPGERSWLPRLVSLASARLWVALEEQHGRSRDGELLSAWLERLRYVKDAIVPSLGFLDGNARARMVRAAVALLAADADTGNFEHEFRLRSSVTLARIVAQPSRLSVASIHLFWEDFGEAFDETRTLFHLLVYVVLTYDSAAQGRFFTTLDLVESGLAKPYLVSAVGWYLHFQHTSLIAWLLTRPSTAAFGLSVLISVQLTEPSTMDEWDHREARTHQRRLVLFREALTLTMRTFAEHNAGAGELIDVLRVMARPAVRGPLQNDSRAIAHVRRTDELFTLTMTHVVEARAAHAGPATSDHESSLLADRFEGVLDALQRDFPNDEITEQLKIAIEMLRFVRDRANAFASRGTEIRSHHEQRLAEFIVDRYDVALDVRASTVGGRFRFYHPSPSLQELPWEVLGASLSMRLGALEKWLLVPALQDQLSKCAHLPESERDDVAAGVAVRLRTHLAVLIRTYLNVASLASGRSHRDRLQRHIEAAIETYLSATTDVAQGTVALFDADLAHTADETQRQHLIDVMVESICRFPPTACARVLAGWIDSTRDPLILIAIEDSDAPESLKSKARSRLEENETIQGALTNLHFDGLIRATQAAAAANHANLTNILLARGDAFPQHLPWRVEWEKAAFRARLLLAYHQRDRSTVDTLSLPPSATSNAQRRSTLESSRTFYQALLDLETNAQGAQASFATQLAHEPDSPSLLINLFAAELRLAANVTTPTDKREAYENALMRWDRRTSVLSDRRPLEPFGSLNVFIALDGSERDAEFDLRWNALGELQRSRLDLTKVRLENLRRRGLIAEVRHLVDEARVRFGGSLPKDLAEDATETTASATQVEQTINYYERWHQIKGLPAHELAKLLGPTGSTQTADLVQLLHMTAAFEMVKRRMSIEALWKENRLNDVMVSFVDMQLAHFGWTVPDQSPGGESATGKEPGLRDWTIKCGRQEVAIAEALRLRYVSSKPIQEHVTRLLEKYNPQGAGSTCLVIYYEAKSFSDFCARYKTYAADTKNLSFGAWKLKNISDWSDRWQSSTVRTFRLTLVNGDFTMMMDHILVDLMLGLDETEGS